jgi:hypothetical protein
VEVWVATPLGVIRYSDAKIDIASEPADGTRLTVTAAMAQAELLPAPAIQLRRGDDVTPAKAFAEVQVAAGATLVAERAAVPIPRLLPQLVRACSQESEGALQAARRLSERGDAGAVGALGELASAHVRARRRARAACETARAAAGLAPAALGGSLLAELTAADEKRNQLTPLPARR